MIEYSGNGFEGYGFALDDLNASSYSELSFLVKGQTGKEQFRVGLKDTDQNEIKLLAHTLLPEGKVTTGWQRIIIPLDRFQERSIKINPAALENFSLDFDDFSGDGIIYVDEIRFITWNDISSQELNDGLYQWNISRLPPQVDHLLIKAIAIDKGGNSGSDQSNHYLFRELPQPPFSETPQPTDGCFILTLNEEKHIE